MKLLSSNTCSESYSDNFELEFTHAGKDTGSGSQPTEVLHPLCPQETRQVGGISLA